jgi:hypothetical protein
LTGYKYGRILPAGIYLEEGRLTVHYGVPFELSLTADAPRDQADRQAARQVMERIGRQLPEWMRGDFR